MKTHSLRYSTIWCLLLTLFVANSCKDDTAVTPVYDGIKMRINVTGGFVEPSGNSSSLNRSKASASSVKHSASALEVQTQIIPLSDGLNLVAKLVPEQQTAPIRSRQSTGGLRADVQQDEVRNALPQGTEYRILVYDENGTEVRRFEKTVDANGSSFDEFTLDATGETTTYTFVAYSAGTSALPTLAENSTLANAIVTTDGEKLMHFVQTVELNHGDNNIEVVLANKMSEITTVLNGEGIGVNAITGVGDFVFENATHSEATLKLSDGVMTYLGNAEDKPVTFPVFTAESEVTSLPTVLVHDQTTTATLSVEYIEIAGSGRSEPFQVENVRIEPGVKYNLVLELDRGNCLFDVDPETFDMRSQDVTGCAIQLAGIGIPIPYNTILFFRQGSLIFGNPTICNLNLALVRLRWQTNTTVRDGAALRDVYNFSTQADAGVVMNIEALDNSFHMQVNGTVPTTANPNPAIETDKTITTNEIQFQTPGRNIRFTDGTYHGDGTIPNIWDITTGTDTNPVLRISISDNGTVSIAGRKSNTDLTLYPMELLPGTTFNTVEWRTSGTQNNVQIVQTVSGPTYIRGQITGKRVDACN